MRTPGILSTVENAVHLAKLGRAENHQGRVLRLYGGRLVEVTSENQPMLLNLPLVDGDRVEVFVPKPSATGT